MGEGRMKPWRAWGLWCATLLCAPGAWVPLTLANGEGWAAAVVGGLLVPLMPSVAVVLTTRRPANPVGWLLAGAGLAFCFGLATTQAATFGHRHDWPDVTLALLLVLSNLAYLGIALVPFAVILFPDGRPPSPRWRRLLVAGIFGIGLVFVAGGLATDRLEGDEFTVANPLAVSALHGPASVLAAVGAALIVAVAIGAVVAVIVRWRHSYGDERAQMKWVALVGSVAVAVMLATQLAGADDQLVVVAAAVLFYGGIPAAITVAILKYRLYDIDLLINRTIVYGVVTVGLAVGYLGVVGLATTLLGDATRAGTGLVAAALIAVAFTPFRAWVQRAVDRRLFGDRHQPSVAVERLGRRIDATGPSSELLPAIVDAIASSLRLPYVAIETEGSDLPIAALGTPIGPLVETPLLCQSIPVGTLRVGGRSPREGLSRADREVLAQLAIHVGVAVRAAALTDEVERSRSRLVAAQEEERRRLRRDLHDELGPALTAIGFGIDTADNLLANGSATSEIHTLLARVRAQTDAAIVEIRRVAYALRPPALDELGLAGALAAQAESLGRSGLAVHVTSTGPVDDLPAAVEVAAYRIGVEAMTNAARHAHADECHVRIHVTTSVSLVISDNGTGLPAGYRAGVGVSSMRERAAELGGRVEIDDAAPCGCTVRALLPLGEQWATA